MSERKVLNKYFPPDFDPNNIPKLRLEKNRQWNIRIMAPFNMRCSTCGEYIYKGKKFNSRKEDVEDDDYLGLKIFRFYIRCPRCVAEISFKTDPVNTDYALEAGATRNFEALKTAETLARKELEEKEAAEKNNPMKMLENRTKASLREMEMLETLEDLKQLNTRHADVDHEQMLLLNKAYEKTLAQLQEEEDDKFVESLFGGEGETGIKRVADEEETDVAVPVKRAKSDKPTDILMQKSQRGKDEGAASSSCTAAVATKKQSKFGILVKKKSAKPELHRNSSSPLTTSDRTEVVIAKLSADEVESASSCHVPAAGSVPAPSSSMSAASSSVSTASSRVSAAVGSVPGAHDNISSGEVLTVDGLGLLGAYSDSDDSGNDPL